MAEQQKEVEARRMEEAGVNQPEHDIDTREHVGSTEATSETQKTEQRGQKLLMVNEDIAKGRGPDGTGRSDID